jgi:hypothetical protein
MCATVSVLQGKQDDATIQDVLDCNKLIRTQRHYANLPMIFKHDIKDEIELTFCDASWARRKDGASQGGFLTISTDKKILQGELSPFSIVQYSSRKLQRVARSSTSAEVQGFGNALDSHEFAKLLAIELESSSVLDLRNVDQYLQQRQTSVVCDAKNIYDALERIETSGLQLEEKRTAVELLGIKEIIRGANVKARWVNSDQELADGLTKPWKFDQLIKAMQKGCWRIIFDPDFVSARKARKLQPQRNGYGILV